MTHRPTAFLWIPVETGWHMVHAGFISGHHQPWINWSHQNPNLQLIVAVNDLRFQKGETRLTLSPGSIVVLRPNEHHRSWGPTDPSAGFYFVQFRTSLTPTWRSVPPFVGTTGPEVHVNHVALPETGRITHRQPVIALFQSLVEVHLGQQLYHQVTANGLLAQIMSLVSQDALRSLDATAHGGLLGAHGNGHSHWTPEESSRSFSPRQIEITQCIIEYIEENLHRSFPLNELSDQLNLSYKYVAKVAKSCLGMSLSTYLHRRRMHKARALLLNPEYSVAQVAQAVGFDDPHYFTRVFSRIEGVSPTVYRSSTYVPNR